MVQTPPAKGTIPKALSKTKVGRQARAKPKTFTRPCLQRRFRQSPPASSRIVRRALRKGAKRHTLAAQLAELDAVFAALSKAS
jgi:hypothetical protein